MDQEFLSFSESGFYLPQEEVLEKKYQKHKLSIGIPKEIFLQEKELLLLPTLLLYLLIMVTELFLKEVLAILAVF